MVDGKMLTEKSKEELIEQILGQYKEIEELKKKLEELQEKVKAEQQKQVDKFAKANTTKKRKKRPGRKVGHVGITRHAPDQIDEVLEQTLQECPDCHHPLANPVEVIEQV